MKKLVFALTILLGAFNGVAHAEASVSMYGILDVAVRYDSDVAAGKPKLAELAAW